MRVVILGFSSTGICAQAGWVATNSLPLTHLWSLPTQPRGTTQGGRKYLELSLQLGPQCLHLRGQREPGGQGGGASQQHGVGAIEELVAKKLIVLPALVDLLCGVRWSVGGGIYHSPEVPVLQALPLRFRHMTTLSPAPGLSFWGPL